MIANNSIHTNPPLCITEDQLAAGFDIIDRALALADAEVACAGARPEPMTTASGSLRAIGRPRSADEVAPARSRRRQVVGIAIVLVALVVIGEGAKWLGGDPWRLHAQIAGAAIDYEHVPPF